jgi:hypothetical protein
VKLSPKFHAYDVIVPPVMVDKFAKWTLSYMHTSFVLKDESGAA